MLNVVIFGGPGSGKGTQSEKLIQHYGLHHISTGEVLRDHIARGTDLGVIADSYISKGNLIPDDLMVKVLAQTLDESDVAREKGVIFDGFPRTIPQAQALEKMLNERGSSLHAVIGLEVPDNELVDRLLLRGKESGRSDDNGETIKKRLEVYHNQTSPLKDYYTKQGAYKAINGSGDVDRIFNDIRQRLDKTD